MRKPESTVGRGNGDSESTREFRRPRVADGHPFTVSRLHAEFRCENGEFHIVETNSLYGTYLNRQPVDTATLTNGDEIQIGNYRLVSSPQPPPTDRTKTLWRVPRD